MTAHQEDTSSLNRRRFLQATAVAASTPAVAKLSAAQQGDVSADDLIVDDFHRPDSLYHGDGWESLNPGYWQITQGALRRRLTNVGDRARRTGFPFHYETHHIGKNDSMPVEYDPSLHLGMLWRRDWKLTGNFTIQIDATINALVPEPAEGDDPAWKMYQPGYGLFGICLGGRTLFESYDLGGKPGNAAWMALYRDDGEFGLFDHTTNVPKPAVWTVGNKQPTEDNPTPIASVPRLQPGDRVTITVTVSGDQPKRANVSAALSIGEQTKVVSLTGVERQRFLDGYFGVVARGLLDFEINQIRLTSGSNQPLKTPVNDLLVAYALGDTLMQVNDEWKCTVMALFRSNGEQAEVRISDSPDPDGGWQAVPVAGRSEIVSNDFRHNTAILPVTLPHSPAEATLYFTVWKDGHDVTGDVRIGTASTGLGTGMIGEVPSSGRYVGRLPKLEAPYRICGLSCHAITGGAPNLPESGRGQGWFLHDQPTPDAYEHLDDYEFQVMLWEDDVWYLELTLYPPSTDDAYKVITNTIAGPTSRWQMMRHWNVINPGDHDHGMDDVKGPEQIVIRNNDSLGQDASYMRRNFQIVSHLVQGVEDPSGTENPKRWRRWKMPNRDFSLLVCDARLWRTSQDTNIWDDEGWGEFESLYDRTDPTRALLGEEQFAWLQEMVHTDSSPIICLTGINAMHTIWRGTNYGPKENQQRTFAERDRVAADYAGWVAAGCDRVIELLGTRPGIVSVYGDVHNGSIVRNTNHGLYECSFGPIGRTGGRSLIPGFGPTMKDFDGRPLEVIALYTKNLQSPSLAPLQGPTYWNFLEMTFDPRAATPTIGLTVRNLIDGPDDDPRGGGQVATSIDETGRDFTCRLPKITTLPDANVLLMTTDGRPLRGVRSLADGTVPVRGLVDVSPDTQVVITAIKGAQADGQIVVTEKLG